METEKFYLRVGIFFIAVTFMFVYYLITFGGDDGRQSMDRYAIYFNESVSGLTRGAPVKLKGIPVGLINEIGFASNTSDRILVTVDINEDAPINTSTVAMIDVQGITGTAYLSLENNPAIKITEEIKKIEGEKHPVIQSKKSDLQALISNAPEALGRIAKAAEQTEKLLSNDNVAAIQVMLGEATNALREFKMLARTVREDPSVVIRGNTHQGYKVEQ